MTKEPWIKPGQVNRNQQKVIRRLPELKSNHISAMLWLMECQRCNEQYASNGCDAKIRKCPNCQRGAPPSVSE